MSAVSSPALTPIFLLASFLAGPHKDPGDRMLTLSTPVRSHKWPLAWGKTRARGGTRTGLQPLQTLGSPGNMRNPGQTGTSTTQSEAQSVDSNHTHIHPLITQKKNRIPYCGNAVFCAGKGADYGRVCPVLRFECLRLQRTERPAKHCRSSLWRHLLLPSHGLLGRHSHDEAK